MGRLAKALGAFGCGWIVGGITALGWACWHTLREVERG